MQVALLFLLAALAATALAGLRQTMRGREKRRLLRLTHGLVEDTPERIGISVLCSGVGACEQVENLLSVEYARYEVIVVLDARRQPVEFARLCARYRIIGVDYVPTGELPSAGVRQLGRSRIRRFRRLVVVDRAADTATGDFDAAAGVAAFDYLLPVMGGCYLLPGAIGRLLAELGDAPSGAVAMIRARIGVPAVLYARESVVAAGGFGGKGLRRVPRRVRREVWEPILYRPGRRSRRFPFAAAGTVFLAAGFAAGLGAGWWMWSAAALTAAIVCMACACIRQAVADATADFDPPLWDGARLRRKRV